MNALMYHDVVAAGDEDSSGFPGRDAALYKVTPETFAAHLDAIARVISFRPDLPVPAALPALPAAPALPAPVNRAPASARASSSAVNVAISPCKLVVRSMRRS